MSARRTVVLASVLAAGVLAGCGRPTLQEPAATACAEAGGVPVLSHDVMGTSRYEGCDPPPDCPPVGRWEAAP